MASPSHREFSTRGVGLDTPFQDALHLTLRGRSKTDTMTWYPRNPCFSSTDPNGNLRDVLSPKGGAPLQPAVCGCLFLHAHLRCSLCSNTTPALAGSRWASMCFQQAVPLPSNIPHPCPCVTPAGRQDAASFRWRKREPSGAALLQDVTRTIPSLSLGLISHCATEL